MLRDELCDVDFEDVRDDDFVEWCDVLLLLECDECEVVRLLDVCDLRLRAWTVGARRTGSET